MVAVAPTRKAEAAGWLSIPRSGTRGLNQEDYGEKDCWMIKVTTKMIISRNWLASQLQRTCSQSVQEGPLKIWKINHNEQLTVDSKGGDFTSNLCSTKVSYTSVVSSISFK